MEDVVAKEAFALQRKVIANSRLVRVWLSFVSLRMRILWSLLSLALPVLVNKCWLNSGFPSLTQSWQLQCWPDWTCIVSRWFWLGSHFTRGTSYAEWIDSGAAGFVQARPFNLWCRMRVGPRIPSCCPSNRKCEPMKNDLLNTEFWRARSYRDCPCIERNVMKRVSSVPSWYSFVCAILLSFVHSFTVQRKSCN